MNGLHSHLTQQSVIDGQGSASPQFDHDLPISIETVYVSAPHAEKTERNRNRCRVKRSSVSRILLNLAGCDYVALALPSVRASRPAQGWGERRFSVKRGFFLRVQVFTGQRASSRSRNGAASRSTLGQSLYLPSDLQKLRRKALCLGFSMTSNREGFVVSEHSV